MRKLANGLFLPPPLELGLLLALSLLFFAPQAAPRRANPTTSAATLSSHVHRWLRLTRYLPLWTFPPRVEANRLWGADVTRHPVFGATTKSAPLLGREADECTSSGAEVVRLGLLEHAVDAVSLRRVQDAAAAEPERDVRRLPLVAVGDEVARPQLLGRDRGSGRLLLVGVARDEQAEPAVGHVDEAGAVDAALGHAAPEVRRAEVGPRLGDRIAVPPRQRLLPHPARIVVRGEDPRPAAAALLHAHGVSAEKLRDALGGLVGLGPHGLDVDEAELEHGASLALERVFAYRKAACSCGSTPRTGSWSSLRSGAGRCMPRRPRGGSSRSATFPPGWRGASWRTRSRPTRASPGAATPSGSPLLPATTCRSSAPPTSSSTSRRPGCGRGPVASARSAPCACG